MEIFSSSHVGRPRTTRSGLYVGVAMVAGLMATPAYAQSAGSAQDSETQALRRENESLRQQLEALRHGGQQPAAASVEPSAAPTPPAVTPEVRVRDDRHEIVVTKVRERQQVTALRALVEVPKAVSVITPEELKVFDQVSLPDALSRLGNVRWNDGNPRTGSFSMRGLTASAGSDTIDPSVGINVDGVPYASLGLAALVDLIDIEQVNVTKGPQGNEGGRQTSVGLITIQNRKPSFTPDGSAALTVGKNGALRAELAGGGPVIDDLLAFRISAYRDQRNGNWWNTYKDVVGLQSYPNVDRTYGRVQLLFTPASNLSLRLQYEIAPNGSEYINGLSFAKPTPLTYASGTATSTLTPTYRLSRSWFTQQSDYKAGDYYNVNPQLDANRAITTGTKGATADLEWNLGKHTFSFLSAWHNSYFLAGNDDGTPFDITKDGGYITTYEQFTQEAKLKGTLGDNAVDYTAGLFFLESDSNSLSRTRYGSDWWAYNATDAQYATLNATPAGQLLGQLAANRAYTGTQAYLHNISEAAYVHLDWHTTPRLTLTTGLRYSREKRELTQGGLLLDEGYGSILDPVGIGATTLAGASGYAANTGALLAQGYTTAQIAAARALRTTVLGSLYPLRQAQPWRGNLYQGQVSARYTFSPQWTGYATVQYGEKPGLPQVLAYTSDTVTGSRELPVGKEKTLTYEIGARASLFQNTLAFSGDLYRAEIWDFQQGIYVYDSYLTSISSTPNVPIYTSATGNVPKVRSQGAELQVTYTGIKNLQLNLNGAYTDARYVNYPTAGQPSENGDLAAKYRSLSGYTLPNAPKLQFNATGTYRRPVLNDKVLHASLGYTFTSKQNVDAALSAYGVTHAYGIVDLSLGLGRRDGLFDVNLIMRNVFNELRYDQGWSSITVYQKPRWFGVSFSSRFL